MGADLSAVNWANTVSAIRHSPIPGGWMTALVGRDVQRTFSGLRRDWTGLPRYDTHETSGEDLGKFGDVVAVRAGEHQALKTRNDWSFQHRISAPADARTWPNAPVAQPTRILCTVPFDSSAAGNGI